VPLYDAIERMPVMAVAFLGGDAGGQQGSHGNVLG
jgi:hypothetical protein